MPRDATMPTKLDSTSTDEYVQKSRRVCEEAGVEPDSLTVLPFLA